MRNLLDAKVGGQDVRAGLSEGDIGSHARRTLSIRLKAQRTRGLEAELVSVKRWSLRIRSPRAHVLLD